MKLKDYITSELLRLYKELNDENTTSLVNNSILSKIKVLEDIERICLKRGRF